jgi:hypothetical protein
MIDYSLILSVNFQGKQWAMSDVLDYATLEWHNELTKPTQAELNALWESTQAAQVAAKEAEATAKTAALAKLTALGLTTADLTALGL